MPWLVLCICSVLVRSPHLPLPAIPWILPSKFYELKPVSVKLLTKRLTALKGRPSVSQIRISISVCDVTVWWCQILKWKWWLKTPYTEQNSSQNLWWTKFNNAVINISLSLSRKEGEVSRKTIRLEQGDRLINRSLSIVWYVTWCRHNWLSTDKRRSPLPLGFKSILLMIFVCDTFLDQQV